MISLEHLMQMIGIEYTNQNVDIVTNIIISSKYKSRLVYAGVFKKLQIDVCDNEMIEYIRYNYQSYLENLNRYNWEQAAIAQYGSVEERIKHDTCIANMMTTTGYNFEGYRIIHYAGCISANCAVNVDRGMDSFFLSTTDTSNALSNNLAVLREKATNDLKDAAYFRGCNGIIGIDYDYITLDPQTANSSGGTTYLPYVFCVVANGTAVIVEKELQQ